MLIPEPPTIHSGAFDGIGGGQPIWCGIFIEVFWFIIFEVIVSHFKLHRSSPVLMQDRVSGNRPCSVLR